MAYHKWLMQFPDLVAIAIETEDALNHVKAIGGKIMTAINKQLGAVVLKWFAVAVFAGGLIYQTGRLTERLDGLADDMKTYRQENNEAHKQITDLLVRHIEQHDGVAAGVNGDVAAKR